MKKTIVYKIRVFPTISETFIISNVVAAIKAGYEVKIIPDIVLDKKVSSQLNLLDKYNILDKVVQFKIPRNKYVRYYQAFRLLSDPILLIYFLKYCFLKRKITLLFLFTLKFYQQFKTNTIFHVHFANREKPLFDLKRIGFIKKSKIIITFHGFDAHFLPTGKELKDYRINFNKYVSGVTVNSKYLKNILLAKGFSENSVSIVPVGIDFGLFKPYINERNDKKRTNIFSILSIGRLIPLKGHWLGLEVIKVLKERGYEIFYTIIGMGSEFDRLNQMITTLDLDENVTLLGNKNQNQLNRYFLDADIFLFPSTYDETGRREAFGLVSIEAQAMGLPVIGFKSGGFPETIIDDKTGYAVTDRDIEVLADKIELLIKDSKLLEQMSKYAIRHAREMFSPINTVNKYLEYYT